MDRKRLKQTERLRLVLVPGNPQLIDVKIDLLGIQSEGSEYDAPEYHGCFVTY